MSRDCCCGCGGAPATAGGLAAREVGGAARGLRGVSRSSAGAGATGAGEGVAAPTPPTADAVCSPLCGGSAPLQCRRALACGPRLPSGSGSWLAFGVAGEVFSCPPAQLLGRAYGAGPNPPRGSTSRVALRAWAGPNPALGRVIPVVEAHLAVPRPRLAFCHPPRPAKSLISEDLTASGWCAGERRCASTVLRAGYAFGVVARTPVLSARVVAGVACGGAPNP